jgi:SAM-dependent methyltransferase
MKVFKTLFLVFIASSCNVYDKTWTKLPFLQKLNSNGFGLDVNCNTGLSTNYIQSLFPNLTFFGIDSNNTAIDIAKKQFHSKNFYMMDLENQTMNNDKEFQVIQISDYTNCWNVLQKSYEILENNGLLIIRYKEYDSTLLLQLFRRNQMFPKKETPFGIVENMYLFPNENTAVIIK